MFTFFEISRHVITGNQYPERKKNPELCKESKAYQVLKTATNPEIIQQVRDYVAGHTSIEEAGKFIHSDNAYPFLAAAKIVSLDTPDSMMKNTTFKIRELCVCRSKNEENGRDTINIINAFSNPPLDMEEVDVLLANELDNNHPVVKKASFGEERNSHLKRIYTYCQKQAQLLPEVACTVESVIGERFKTMISMAEHLPKETMFVFKGCSGAGKSYALKSFAKEQVKHVTETQAVQSTDNLKNDIKVRTGNIFSDNQVHLFGFSAFKMLTEVMKSEHPDVSTLQEGWFNSQPAIEGLFRDLGTLGLKLDMRDFDGDGEAIFLRVLSRFTDPNSPKPPIDAVIRGFKTSRESRPLLLNSLRKEDRYHFRYVDNQGTIHDEMDPKRVVCDPTEVDLEIERTKKVLIRDEHVQMFGDSLKSFLGMTIEAAFLKVKDMKL